MSTDPTTDRASSEATTEHEFGNGSSIPLQQPGTIKNEKKGENEKNGKKVSARATHKLDHHFLKLEPDSTWIANPQYVKVGRRPLRNYPDMFLTPYELANVFEQLSDAGVPVEQFKLVFMRVAARLNTYKAQGKNLATISVYNWLTGWAKSDVVKELTASCNLERSKAYLAGAKI